jgi:hypothetical protein
METPVEACSTDVIVLCGGRGTRIRDLTEVHMCKALIPILGRPCLEHILRQLRGFTFNRVYVCVDRAELISPVAAVVERSSVANAETYVDNGRGPMQTLYEVSARCTKERVMILFGHHLIVASHIQSLLSVGASPAVSLFKESSESHCKITSVNEHGRCTFFRRCDQLVPLREHEWYIDLPYSLPTSFFQYWSHPSLKRLFVMGPLEIAELSADECVIGVPSSFPHEFHSLSDLPLVEEFARSIAEA